MRKIKLLLGALALVTMFGAMSCKNASAPASTPAPTIKPENVDLKKYAGTWISGDKETIVINAEGKGGTYKGSKSSNTEVAFTLVKENGKILVKVTGSPDQEVTDFTNESFKYAGFTFTKKPTTPPKPPKPTDEAAPTTDEGKAWAKAVGGYEFTDGKHAFSFSTYGTKGTFDHNLEKTGGDDDPKKIKSVEINKTGAKVVYPPYTVIPGYLEKEERVFSYETINNVVVALKYLDATSSTDTYYYRKDYYDWSNFTGQKTFSHEGGANISFPTGDTFAKKNGFAGQYVPAGGTSTPITFTLAVEGDGKNITKVTFSSSHADLNGKVAKIEGMKEGTKKIIIDGKEYIAQ